MENRNLEIVRNAKDNKPVEVRKLVDTEMRSKIASQVEEMKKDLAKKIFGQ